MGGEESIAIPGYGHGAISGFEAQEVDSHVEIFALFSKELDFGSDKGLS